MARNTPLHDAHTALGARMVEFAGWMMPVQYSGVIDEHQAVRTAAGIFDVSHMGEVEITGPGAANFIDRLTTNDVASMTDGKAQYSLMLNDEGTVIDDVIIYRFSAERFIIVVNASNVTKDVDWIARHAPADAAVKDVSDDYALIAFQGPLAPEILQELTDTDLAGVKRYHFTQGTVATVAGCIIARTGYTGEDGFEIFVPGSDAARVWNALLDAGKDRGVKPAGLGARDTLRLEMKYSLYGHEITEETNPLEAGLGWVVKMDKEADFIGKKALEAIKAVGLKRKLVGFKMKEKAIPREGYAIVVEGEPAGIVTSGTMSPSLNEPIGIGYVPRAAGTIGTTFSIDIRGKLKEAEVVKTPFYTT